MLDKIMLPLWISKALDTTTNFLSQKFIQFGMWLAPYSNLDNIQAVLAEEGWYADLWSQEDVDNLHPDNRIQTREQGVKLLQNVAASQAVHDAWVSAINDELWNEALLPVDEYYEGEQAYG